jgi:DNA polymerase III subunit gamma/tau
MSYQVIARKYRPKSFDQVIGQDVSVRIMRNSIHMNRVPSAMLITGIRGTGKTSLARLYAKALNCSNFDKDVCNTCQSCIDANNMTHPDIREFDAASNNGVDFMRSLGEIVNNVGFYKKTVIILDEVHMFTPQAQASFLKLLEEPPENVIFLLVTTDPVKLIDTIRSRCLSMPLKPLSIPDVITGIKYILEAENMKYTDDFVNILAKASNGSLRDIQQYLEQAISSAGGETITSDVLVDSLGIISLNQYKMLASSICSLSLHKFLKDIQHWYSIGIDLNKLFYEGVPTFLRDALVYLLGIDVTLATGMPIQAFQNNLKLSEAQVRSMLSCWSNLEDQMRYTHDPKTIWYVFATQICELAI